MGWRKHVAIVGGAVAVSGAAWAVTGLAWQEPGPQVVIDRNALDDSERGGQYGWFSAPRCTPPPGLREGTYACVVPWTPPPGH